MKTTDTSAIPDSLSFALFLVERGVPVFPIWGVTQVDHKTFRCSCPKGKGCTSPGKHPKTPNGFRDATLDPEQVMRWYKQDPACNWGAVTGGTQVDPAGGIQVVEGKPGLVVVDVDGPEGLFTMVQLEEQGYPFPPTLKISTGRGQHYYYWGVAKSGTSTLGKKVDTRGEGGYVVIPGSRHISGSTYTLLDNPGGITSLPPFVEEILEQVKESKRASTATKQHQKQVAAPISPLPKGAKEPCVPAQGGESGHLAEDSPRKRILAGVGEGERNRALFELGCSYRALGLSREEILCLLTYFNAAYCFPSLDDQEVDRTATSAASYDVADFYKNNQPNLSIPLSRYSAEHLKATEEKKKETSPTETGPSGCAEATQVDPASDTTPQVDSTTSPQLRKATTPMDVSWRNRIPGAKTTKTGGFTCPATPVSIASALQLSPTWAGKIWRDEEQYRVHVDGYKTLDEAATDLLFFCSDTLGVSVNISHCHLAIQQVASLHGRSPRRDYLESLTWDGTPRMDHLLERYFGVESSALHRKMLRCHLIASVARLFDPGCQHDLVLVLQGSQGIRKSSFISELYGTENTLSNVHLDTLGERDSLMKLHSAWAVELAEMTGLSRADQDKLKCAITTRQDTFRPPYGKDVVTLGRRFVLWGTTNNKTPLRDETGGRRWHLIPCQKQMSEEEIQELRSIRDQVWAEAVAAYKAGEKWYLTEEDLIREAARQAEANTSLPHEEVVRDLIQAYLLNPYTDLSSGYIRAPELTKILSPTVGRAKARVMEQMDFEHRKVREGSRTVNAFLPVYQGIPLPRKEGEVSEVLLRMVRELLEKNGLHPHSPQETLMDLMYPNGYTELHWRGVQRVLLGLQSEEAAGNSAFF